MEKDTIVKEWLEFVATQFFWGSLTQLGQK
jgi:hypothetical protein